MKWPLKFPAKGKKEGPDGGKLAGLGVDSFRSLGGSGGGGGGTGSNNGGALRSNSGGEGDGETGDSRTPIVTPPDAKPEAGVNGEKEGGEEEILQPSTEAADIASAPPFTVDSTGNGGGGADDIDRVEADDREERERRKEEERDWGGMEDSRSEAAAEGEGDRQDDVFDDDSQEDADSLHASKTARIKSFADDPEGHVLGDMDGEWDGAAKDEYAGEGDERRGLSSPRASRGDDRSGTGGAGSQSYHSGGRSADAAGTEEFNSNASPDHPGGKANTYASFGGMSGGVSLGQSEPLDGEQGHRLDEELVKEGPDDEDDAADEQGGRRQRLPPNEKDRDGRDDVEDDDQDEEHVDVGAEVGFGAGLRHRNHVAGGHSGNNRAQADHHYQRGGRSGTAGSAGVGPGGAAGNGIGGPDYGSSNGGGMRARDADRRANAHVYGDGMDMSRDAPGYGGGGRYQGGGSGDRQQRQSHGMALSGNAHQGSGGVVGSNGLSAVDSRATAALAQHTRLTSGGAAVQGDRHGSRPESSPSIGQGQAAAAAESALRRGPTPGSHSLPSMVLVPLEALKAHRRVPRSSDRRALVRYRDLPDRSRSFVVFVSHAWMRPHTTPSFAHPDTSSRGGEKYRLIAEAGDRIRAHLPPDVRVLLWIDYSCVDQGEERWSSVLWVPNDDVMPGVDSERLPYRDSTRRSKATMRGMREYMRRCDAILTVYPGEAADNGEEFLPNRFVKSCSWAGSYKSLAHYCTRGWCRLEMLLGQTEPLPQDGFMFNFLVPKKKKASGAKASVGDRPHFLYGAHQRPHNGRIDVVPRQSSRWFEEHHPEQGNFTHESDRDAIRAVLSKQTNTLAKKSAAIAARYGTDPRRGGGSSSSAAAAAAAAASAAAAAAAARGSPNSDIPGQQHFSGEYGRPH